MASRLLETFRAAVAALGLIVVALAGLAMTGPVDERVAPLAAQSAPGTADVVVDFGDGRVTVDRVVVTAPLSGLALLDRTGLDVARSGGAVCAIGGVGCPATDCFCQCRAPGAGCAYWAYFHGRPDGGWTYDEQGAANATVAAGEVDGWVWGAGLDLRPITATRALRGAMVGLDWLRGHQLPGGGIADHVGFTAEAIFAARGAGSDPRAWRRGGPSLVDFLSTRAGEYSREGAAQAGKVLAGAVAAGLDPRSVGGEDLVARVLAGYDRSSGRFGATTWDQAWSLIGLAAAREAVDPEAVAYLAEARAPAGGWGFGARAAEADADSTGLALQALAASGVPPTAPVMVDALGFLDREQAADGGWGHGGPSNVNSTAYAVQGLLAAGEDPRGGRWRAGVGAAPGGPDPVDFLLGTQRPDGRFAFDTFPSDLVATSQALPALTGRAAPLGGTGFAAARAANWALAHRSADGAFEGFNPGATIDAALALAAAGRDPTVPAASGKTAGDYLAPLAMGYAGRGPAAAGKLAAGLVALGADPRAFGGVDCVAAIRAAYDAERGVFGSGGTWESAWAILGLRAAAEDIPPRAARYLLDAAAEGGGWGYAADAQTADADSTGLALQALAAAGVPGTDPAVRGALRFLRRTQRPDGGFAGFDGPTSVESTALAISGLAAFGQAVDGPGWMRGAPDGLVRFSPREAIMARQGRDGGYMDPSGAGDPMSTYAALFGLSARPLPIVPRSAAYLPAVHRDS